MNNSVYFDKKQSELDALHASQIAISRELVPMLNDKQLDLLNQLIDVYGKLNDFQNGLIDDACKMIDALALKAKQNDGQ